MATTENPSFLDSLSKGQLPSLPVSLSLDSSTILSLSAVAIIIVSIVLFFKFRK